MMTAVSQVRHQWDKHSVAGLLESWAAERPEQVVLVDDSGSAWRKGEYWAHLRRTANAFWAQGLLPGDHIAVVDGATRVHLDVEYAALLSGLVRVPLEPAMPQRELVAKIRHSEARVVIAGGRSASRACELAGDLHGVEVVDATSCRWRTLVAEQDTERRSTPLPGDLAALHYSSGAGSSLKAVMLSQANLASAVRGIHAENPHGMGRALLNVRPLWPIAAISVLAHLLGGARVVLATFDAEAFGEQVTTHRATSTSLVPSQLVRLLDAGLRRSDVASLERIDVGAAALPRHLAERAISQLGPRLAKVFGMTEAPWSCYLPPSGLADRLGLGPRADSVGRGLPGRVIRIVDATGAETPPGVVGEVNLRGPHVTRGYWRRPALTADVLRDGWLSTGDRGYLDEHGDLYLVGRLDDEIRTGGRAVCTDEVEALLRAHPSVADAAVVGVPDPDWGEVVAAYVRVKRGRQISETELIEHLTARASRYKVPRRVLFVPSVPRSRSGAVEKAKLRARFPIAS